MWRIPVSRKMEEYNDQETDKISKETLYLIFDYPYKYYTFKHFEV